MSGPATVALAGAVALIGAAAAYLWATSGAAIILGLTWIGCL